MRGGFRLDVNRVGAKVVYEHAHRSRPESCARERTASPSVDGLASTDADPPSACGANVYLTDEVFLYRIAGAVANAAGEMVELEDCYRLDTVSVHMRDLRTRRLRVVTPGPVQA